MFDYDSIYDKAVFNNCKRNKTGKWGKVFSILWGGIMRFIWPCDISAFATIGENVRIPHAIGIIIGGTAIVEDNVTIMPNVVIGSQYGGSQNNKQRHATIKHDVMIGANASIIGAIIIGENSTIGAGAIVTKDIPPNSIVVGINNIKSKQSNIET
jgi:serine O-acetyltransferase